MFRSSLRQYALVASSFLALASTSLAQAVFYTDGHGDIGIEYEAGSGEFIPHWHIGAGATVDGSPLLAEDEFAPGQIIARTTATFAAPSGSDTWLGVTVGDSVFRMGNSTFQPNLGWATEEVGLETDWVGETITIQLTGWSVSNPGHFALVSGGNALFSTFGGTVDGNTWLFDVASGHAHAAFYFSDPGEYELTFTWTGEHVIDGAVSGTGTFAFQAGVIPEPSSAAALAGLGSLALVALRRKRRA